MIQALFLAAVPLLAASVLGQEGHQHAPQKQQGAAPAAAPDEKRSQASGPREGDLHKIVHQWEANNKIPHGTAENFIAVWSRQSGKVRADMATAFASMVGTSELDRRIEQLGPGGEGLKQLVEQRERMKAQADRAMNSLPHELHLDFMKATRSLLSTVYGPELRSHVMPAIQGAKAGNPRSAKPFVFEARMMQLQNANPKDIAKVAAQALEREPSNPEALTARAAARLKMNDFQGAAEDAKAALAVNPKDVEAMSVYKLSEGRGTFDAQAHGLGSVGPSPVALGGAGAPAGVVPSPGQERLQLSAQFARSAAVALQMRDYHAAAREAGKAIDANPKNAQAYVYRSIAGAKLGSYGSALDDARMAVGLVPNDRVALNAESLALNRLREYGLAKTQAEAALGLSGRDPESWFNLAYANAGLGDRDGMLAALRRAAELSPERFAKMLDLAVQAPESADLMYLFGEEGPAADVKKPKTASRRDNRVLGIVVAAITGGFLVALGLLHILSAQWPRRLTRAFARRREEADDGLVASSYRLVREIGAGGMGKVYEAKDVSLDRTVAVKKMRDEIRLDARERQRFLKEARMVAALRHPNIVEIYSIVEEPGDIYMIFEYVEGLTLTDLLARKGRLTFREAARILNGMCEAVGFAHAKGIVHRDVKPSNVMLSGDTVKVMDFGIARQARDSATNMTMTNTVWGTPPYMAPEAEQGAVGQASDVYSLGVCFYEMLTGAAPFSGTPAGMLLKKANRDYEKLSSALKGAPAELDAVMDRCLEPDPKKRFRTPREFFKAVEAVGSIYSQ